MSGVIVNPAEDFKSKSNVGVLRNLFSGNPKRKPIDVKINNDIRKEPKISLLKNAKFSEEQRFRRYKTKVEPRLKEKITMNEDDDIATRLKEIFGMKVPDTKPTDKKEDKEVPITINNETTDELPERPTNRFFETYSDWMDSAKKDGDIIELDIDTMTKKEKEELSGMAEPDPKTKSAIALQRLFRGRASSDSPARGLSTPDSARATPLVLTESREIMAGGAKAFRKTLESDIFPDSLFGAETPIQDAEKPATVPRSRRGRKSGSVNKATVEAFGGVPRTLDLRSFNWRFSEIRDIWKNERIKYIFF